MPETLVLSVSLDPIALYAREAVLRSAGYIVVSTSSIKEAIHLFQDGDFDLMILCPTLSAKDRERLTGWIRASGSRIPIASISSASREHIVCPDTTFEKNPVELVAGIKCMLAKQFELTSIGSYQARMTGGWLPPQLLPRV
jgi:CheY-like chemotaxis protein